MAFASDIETPPKDSCLSDSSSITPRDAVEQLYYDTRASIYAYVLCLGVPSTLAQDVAQEVYLRLYQALRKGEHMLNTRAWLFRVAHNLSLNVRAREQSFLSFEGKWDDMTKHVEASPEHALLSRERAVRLHKAIETLSPQQRNCLYLRAEGLRYREISEVMGLSLSTVNEFLRRAIARLAEADL